MTTRKKTIRRCSACQKKGHTKRTCPSLVSETTKAKARVTVRSFGTQKTSPHLIDLKEKNDNAVWEVSPFVEEKKQQKRMVIDLSGVVREASQKKQKEQAVAARISEESYGHFTVEKEKKIIRLPKISTSSWNSSFLYHIFVKSMLVLAVLACFGGVIGYCMQVKKTSDRVVTASTEGFLALQVSTIAAVNGDISTAKKQLQQALSALATANTLVEEEHHIAQSVVSLLPIVGSELQSRQSILQAGQHMALGNTYFIKGIGEAQRDGLLLTDRLEIIRRHLDSANDQYNEALLLLSGVQSSSVPKEYRQNFEEAKLLFATFIDDLDEFVVLAQALETVLGSDDFRRYIVVFQNPHEIRASGGFMGSFAVVDMQKGKIVHIDVPAGGTYEVKGQLDTYLEAPDALQLVNGRWEFHDANWWADFPTTAKKIAWFYEHSRGTTVDGVVALNATVLEKLLQIIGPVASEDFDVVLEAENAITTLQYEVEVDFDKEANTPKAIIGNVLEELLETITTVDKVDVLHLLSGLHQGAKEKEIQVAFFDPAVQNVFSSFGWSGEIVQTEPQQDYLMVVNTNLQGQKSDAKIKQTIDHQAVVLADGSVIDTLVITRKHTGEAGEMFYGVDNVNYMRVYVPEGSELLEAEGFVFPNEKAFHVPEDWYEIDPTLALIEKNEHIHPESGTRIIDSFGKTVFENWLRTPPGEESIVYLTYKLPFKVSLEKPAQHSLLDLVRAHSFSASRYALFMQKQSGVESTIESTIIYPDGWHPVWRSQSDIQLATNGATFFVPFKEDQFIGVVFEQE